MTIFTKSKLAVAVAAGILALAVAPESALAHKTSKKHTHKAVKSTKTTHHHTTEHYSGSSVDARLRAMEDEITSLRSELSTARANVRETGTAKVQEIEAQHAQLEQRVAEVEKKEEQGDDLLFFRGGYAWMAQQRTNELLLANNTLNTLGLSGYGGASSQSGWYVGAGFDHRLTSDAWGLTDLVAVDGEVMFQYMNFGTQTNSLVDAASAAIAGVPAGTVRINNQVTQLTLSASPKMKFNLMEGALRPWIIPFGLSINIISPPSSGVTVLNPGLMLGTGVEYRIWKNLWAGVDFRYNFTGGDFDYKANVGGTTVYNSTNTDGLVTGGYIGLGF